jgi:hypothetical protein
MFLSAFLTHAIKLPRLFLLVSPSDHVTVRCVLYLAGPCDPCLSFCPPHLAFHREVQGMGAGEAQAHTQLETEGWWENPFLGAGRQPRAG